VGLAGPLRQWFAQTHRLGQDVYKLLCDLPAPCLGRRSRFSLHWAVLQNLPYRRLRQPLSRTLPANLTSTQQQVILATGAGLCAAAVEQVSLAETALMLYATLSLTQRPARELVMQLLPALEHFHGQVLPREELSQIDPVEGGCRLKFREGAPVRCRHLLKSAQWQDPWDPIASSLPAPEAQTRFRLEGLGHPAPAPMASHLVLDGSPPLLLQISDRTHGQGRLTPLGAVGEPSAIIDRLRVLLPFATPVISPQTGPAPGTMGTALIKIDNDLTLSPDTTEALRLCSQEIFPHLPGLSPSLVAAAAVQLLEKTRV
jgi:hypothetical protein